MNTQVFARRATASVAFDGTDITGDIEPYLLSLTYTDNEEDEADDLQIKLQDRDGVWLTNWLGKLAESSASGSASSSGSTGGSGIGVYRVTAKTGLNVRTGPGTSYGKLGALSFGATIEVAGIADGWATLTYSGKTAYVSAEYIEAAPGADVRSTAGATAGPSTVLKIRAAIVRENGAASVLDCGEFELDSLSADGPPSTVTLKATALPYTSQIRQTEKSRAWEAYNLSGIAAEIAAGAGLACMYLSASDPYYERVEQYRESDISFLSTLCHNAGLSLKTINAGLVLFDQASYEAGTPVSTIRRGDGSYTKYKLDMSSADVLYSSCRVRYTDPATGKCIEGTAYVDDYDETSKNNQQLEVTAKVTTAAEAKALAAKRLRLHNKYSRTATFTLPGEPSLAAGVTVTLEDWGSWSGKYIVSRATHTVDGSGGYTTQVRLRRVLGGY